MSRQWLRWSVGLASVAIVAAGLGGLAVALGQCAGGGCSLAGPACGAGPCDLPDCPAAACGPNDRQPTTRPAFVNVKCPIMGGAIDPAKVKPELVREFAGGKVAFCCAGCLGPWDKLSDKDKAAKLLAVKPLANVKCPIMGGAINPAKVKPELVREFAGEKVAFCCADCLGPWDKLSDKDKAAKLLAAKPFANASCPMRGRPIKPSLVREFQGQKVGFCCPGCIPAWEKLSEKDKAAKLDAARPKPKPAEKTFANTKCPIMGRTIDLAKVQPQFIREFQGRKVAFCCGGCIPTWEALTDAEKAQKLVEAK